jgi:hypothetical protein
MIASSGKSTLMRIKITVCFEGGLQEHLGIECMPLTLDVKRENKNVADVLSYLCKQGGLWQRMLSDPAKICIILNDEMVNFDSFIMAGDHLVISPLDILSKLTSLGLLHASSP